MPIGPLTIVPVDWAIVCHEGFLTYVERQKHPTLHIESAYLRGEIRGVGGSAYTSRCNTGRCNPMTVSFGLSERQAVQIWQIKAARGHII